jgi:citrate synthase
VSSDVGAGLSGVIACETKINWVDPSSAGLAYRGHSLTELARERTFEEVAFLLIEGEFPEKRPSEFSSFISNINQARQLPMQVRDLLISLPATTHPTRLLRAGISAVGCFEMKDIDDYTDDSQWQDVRLIGQMAEIVALIAAHRRGESKVNFERQGSLANLILTALNKEKPRPQHEKLLNIVWTAYADNGLDAPTFTSMIVGSCHADPYYNIVAGLSALRGPYLGGAGERLLVQIGKLRDPSVARAWTNGMIKRGWRIPGFGHRLYQNADPRVELLKPEAEKLASQTGNELFFSVASAMEKEATILLRPKGIAVNINFYASLIFHMLGSEPQMVPCLFAIGRMAGLIARLREYLENNRLFRPLELYIGHAPRKYISMEQR